LIKIEKMVVKKCNVCNVSYEVKQVGIPSGNRDRETAECLKCGKVIHEDKISGAFQVKEIEENKE
jgi:hypothetical protein